MVTPKAPKIPRRYGPGPTAEEDVVIYERWADEDAFQFHADSLHFAEFLANVGSMMDGASLIRHDVSENTTLM